VTAHAPAGRPPNAPDLRVVAGDPTAEEIAVVTALLTRPRAAAQATAPAFSLWGRKSRKVRPVLRPGFGAWRASTMPR